MILCYTFATMNKKDKYFYIGMHTLFFALLLPAIQSSQLIALGVFKPILLIMPVTMGTITGFLVGFHRQKTREYIWSLQKTQEELETRVMEQTHELKEKNDKLTELLRTDELTKLGNRLLLKETIESQSRKLGKQYVYLSAIMIDIDYFKNYNDHYGHLRGDEILQMFGKILLKSTEDTDIIATRYGGEEFCLVMPGYNHDAAERKAKQLLEEIRKSKVKNKGSKISDTLSISIGVYTTSDASELSDCSIIQEADKALYIAKTKGRDQVCTI